MFIAGDIVVLRDSAEEDICGVSWSYVKEHRTAVVRGKNPSFIYKGKKADEQAYVCEWPEEFKGGHDCGGLCAHRRGQYVTAKHLDIDFEASFAATQRDVVTVPNIEGRPDGKT